MKNKLNSCIEKMKPLLEKIKPWIKTKRAWIEIGLSLVAIICLILAGVSSCGRNNYVYIEATPEPTIEATVEATEMVTATPAVTATPVATATPAATATPNTASNNTSSQYTYGEDPEVPDYSSYSSTGTSPTGAPLYTPVPEEAVNTLPKAYRTLVESCSGSKSYSKYYLYDMDSDGVEELILHRGYDDYEAYIDIYTYTSEGLIFVGDVTGCFANIAGDSNGGIIVYYRRNIEGQNYESIDQLEKHGTDIIVNSMVFSEKVDNYTVWESNVDIPAYSVTDLSPFN